MDVWVDRELSGADFPDQRLKSRLGKLLSDLGRRIGDTLPTACQDWAATKAAYRFFSNQRVDESVILAGHIGPKNELDIVVMMDGTVIKPEVSDLPRGDEAEPEKPPNSK